MQTTMFDIDKVVACGKAYGASITKGEGGITVNGQKMDAKTVFSDKELNENATLAVKSNSFFDSSCTLDGYSTDSYVGTDDAKIAVLAA